MVAICPVVEKKINEKLARLNAFFTFLLIGVSLLFSFEWLLLIVAFDFAVRAYYNDQLSVISRLSKFILKALNSAPAYINAGPKVFAARVGLLLTILTAVFAFLNMFLAASIVGGILIFFSFLESVFGYCVACKLYPYIYQLQVKLNQK